MPDTRFLVTAADIAAAQRAHLRWRMRRAQAWFYPLLFSVLAVLAVMLINPAWSTWDVVEPPLGIFGIYVVLVGLGYLVMPWTSRRMMRRQPGLREEWQVELNELGIRAVTPLQDSTMAWGNYVAWHADARIVMVYHSDHLFQFMPTRSVTPEMSEIFGRKMAGLPRR